VLGVTRKGKQSKKTCLVLFLTTKSIVLVSSYTIPVIEILVTHLHSTSRPLLT